MEQTWTATRTLCTSSGRECALSHGPPPDPARSREHAAARRHIRSFASQCNHIRAARGCRGAGHVYEHVRASLRADGQHAPQWRSLTRLLGPGGCRIHHILRPLQWLVYFCDKAEPALVPPLVVDQCGRRCVLRPAGWSPLEYSEDPMPSLVGLEHGSGGDRRGRSENRWGHDRRRGGHVNCPIARRSSL